MSRGRGREQELHLWLGTVMPNTYLVALPLAPAAAEFVLVAPAAAASPPAAPVPAVPLAPAAVPLAPAAPASPPAALLLDAAGGHRGWSEPQQSHPVLLQSSRPVSTAVEKSMHHGLCSHVRMQSPVPIRVQRHVNEFISLDSLCVCNDSPRLLCSNHYNIDGQRQKAWHSRPPVSTFLKLFRTWIFKLVDTRCGAFTSRVSASLY